MRVSLAALLAGCVLAVTGCGGSEDTAASGGEGAASIVPKSAALYISVDTDLDSDQVNQLEELLAKFPDRDKLFEEVQSGLAEEKLDWKTDVEPALGKTLDLAVLNLRREDAVGILKPGNEAKLKALLAKGDDKPVTRKIDGWTLIADDAATLDRFEDARADGSLKDNARFQDAMAGLPDEALAKLYVNGAAVTAAADEAGAASSSKNKLETFAAALGAESSGLRLDGALKADLQDDLASVDAYEPKLLEAAPKGAYAFLSGNGHGKVAESLKGIPGVYTQLRQYLGIDADELAGLFEGEFALWVSKGIPIPEVTFLSEAKDGKDSLAAVDRLLRMVAASGSAERRTTEIDGVPATQVVVDGIRITYAAFDGKVIVTTRPGAIADVKSGGDSLADDSTFQDARKDADLGDSTFGFLYLNVPELVELVEGYAGLSGESIPPEVSRNLEPLGTFLLQAGGKPEDLKLSAFLAID
jgi:Protein of unknown function (DUF3352)